MAKYLHSLFVSLARTHAECTVKSRSALRMSVCACAFLVMQLNDVRVSPCNLYGWRVCAYAPYTTKYTSFVRLIFSSLILSFCSVSCYFVSIPYAVWAHDVVVVLGVFRLCYILDCCMSSSSSFFCLFRVFVSRESWSLPLLQSPTSPSSLSLLLQLLLLLLLLCCCNCYCLLWCEQPIKMRQTWTHAYSLSEDPTRYTHFTLSVDSLSFRGFDILPAGSILRTMAEVELLVAIKLLQDFESKSDIFNAIQLCLVPTADIHGQGHWDWHRHCTLKTKWGRRTVICGFIFSRKIIQNKRNNSCNLFCA